MRRRLRPALLGAALLGVASTYALAVTWGLPATTISGSGWSSDAPQVAVAPDGLTNVIWRAEGAGDWSVQAATRPAGSATYGTPQRLDVPGSVDQSGGEPQIAVAPDGATTVVWSGGPSSSSFVVQAATRPAGAGAFGPPEDVSVGGGSNVGPQLAVAPDGATTVVWQRTSGGTAVVQAASRPAGRASFGAPQDVGSGSPAGNAWVQVAAGPDGATTLVWRPDDFTIRQATRPAGGATFGNPVDISQAPAGVEAGPPSLVVGADGTATAVWAQGGVTPGSSVMAAVRPAGAAAFGAPQVVAAAAGAALSNAQVAQAPDGTITVVWKRTIDSARGIWAATRAPGATAFGAPVAVSAPGVDSYTSPSLAVAADGAATVAWAPYVGGDNLVDVAVRAAGATSFGPPQRLMASSGPEGRSPYPDPDVAVAPDGSATVAWVRTDDGTSAVAQAATGSPTSYALTAARAGDGTGTITSSPAGIDCGATCTASLLLSTRVTLTATPTAGSRFTGWSGACSGTATTCTVTMLGDRAVTATFANGLRATILPSRSRVESGQSLRVGIRARNTGTSSANTVTSCLRLPAGVRVVHAAGSLRSGRTICFRVGTVAAGTAATRTITVRAASARRVTRYFTGSARASGGVAVKALRTALVITPRGALPAVTG